METEYKLSKIGHKPKKDGSPGKIFISYEVEVGEDEPDAYTVSTGDLALPSFYAALAELNQDVNEICELDLDEDRVQSYIHVRSVSFSHPKNTTGATITALRELRNAYAPLVLNTPHKFFSSPAGEDGGEDEKQILSEETVQRLQTLQKEAIRFINGERAQPSLFPRDAA
ncbi:hypothetical protein FH593_20445 (plasmid) [Leptospira interrogans]|uniref:hypothetical protein n=1 Tax=Leptospira interrogans TaxID=173 RepID=UPI0002C01D08|nr:hypothetical protein [Leptospira interrogans]EMN60320.1 hypothetical protein LEP1GSC092_0046 [Leptospira interrogans serovar Pyrogenes str. R168]ULG90670.1 hypothetical protein FH593_20740 [Leptospira interrogans]ULG90699.1 hypothetical protein FH593_20445 [Leptospira interrogans]UML78401.1 hypothetical protein FH583_21650 [Leptospira interrogans]UML78457.1 hypothetical protein FH583_21500 [Leptospira interrogans]